VRQLKTTSENAAAKVEKEERSYEGVRDVVGLLVLSILSGAFLINEVYDLPPPQPKKKKSSEE
jgi:hypothetical protein